MGEIYEVDEGRPLCGEEEFSALVREMVADEAPRLFAVVQEIGEREDGRIAAWGMAFADHTVVMRDRGTWLSVTSPDRARRMLSRAPDITARLVWVPLSRPDGPVRPHDPGGPAGPAGLDRAEGRLHRAGRAEGVLPRVPPSPRDRPSEAGST